MNNDQSIHRFKSGLICDYRIIPGTKRDHNQSSSDDTCVPKSLYFVKENGVPVNCEDVIDMLEKTLSIPIWEPLVFRIMEER